MPILRFPNPNSAQEEGLLAIGGDLHPESLLLAYRQGIFPWPIEGIPLAWFCPEKRGILKFSHLHLPRSLVRARKQTPLTFSIDRAFTRVIRHCASAPRPGQKGTWITPEMSAAYIHLHELGYAHSAEVWEDERLVGGIYGVYLDGVFSGESMFHLMPNASKFALLHLIENLAAGGCDWMDIQVMTPHMKALGAQLISRDVFLKKLAQTHSKFSGRGGEISSKSQISAPRP